MTRAELTEVEFAAASALCNNVHPALSHYGGGPCATCRGNVRALTGLGFDLVQRPIGPEWPR